MSLKKKKKRPSSLEISNSSLGAWTTALARIGVCVAIRSGRSAFTTRRQVAGRGFPRNFPTLGAGAPACSQGCAGVAWGAGGDAQRGICKPEAEWVGSCGRAWGDRGWRRGVDSRVRPLGDCSPCSQSQGVWGCAHASLPRPSGLWMPRISKRHRKSRPGRGFTPEWEKKTSPVSEEWPTLPSDWLQGSL